MLKIQNKNKNKNKTKPKLTKENEESPNSERPSYNDFNGTQSDLGKRSIYEERILLPQWISGH